MKKIIIGLLIGLSGSISFGVDLSKYFSQEQIKVIDTYLEKFHKNMEKSPINTQCKKYEKILNKIKAAENKKLPKNILALLEYIKEKIITWSKVCKVAEVKNNNQKIQNNKTEKTIKNSQKNQEKIENIKINSDYLRKDSILVDISWLAYTIYGINIKPIYGDIFVKSLLFKNTFGSQADSVIKNWYLVSLTWKILAKSTFSNWYIYFELPKPIKLIKDVNTPFYVAIEINKVDWNTTNRFIKLSLVKKLNDLKTSIISADNWEEIWNWVGNDFASNTYIIRNSKLLLRNYYTRRNLRNWFRQIYSLNISSTWWKALLKSLVLNTYLYKTQLDTWNILVKINYKKYPNVKFEFSWKNYIWNWKLKITFWGNGYEITTWIRLDIYANFERTKDNAKALFRLKDISDYNWIVPENYTWDYSILWSDNTFKNWNYNYFTDSFLDFWKVYEWYLKKN